MIERLIHSLQALAAPADAEGTPPPALAELARQYADALLLASDCPQLELDAEQRDRLFALDALLDRPPATPAQWTEVRAHARAALLTLGHTPEPPRLP